METLVAEKKSCTPGNIFFKQDCISKNLLPFLSISRFPEHLESGLLEVISPPESFYPDMNNLRQTLGDPIERVRSVVVMH